jgi:hypothetical protein
MSALAQSGHYKKIIGTGAGPSFSDSQSDFSYDVPLGYRVQSDRHLIEGKRAADMRLQTVVSVPAESDLDSVHQVQIGYRLPPRATLMA